MKSKSLVAAVIAIAAHASPLHAAVSNINIGTVTQIRSASSVANNNYGADTSLIIGRTTAPDTLRGLLSQSLSSIPSGSIITAITLNLRVNTTGATANEAGAVTLELYQLTGTFLEGTGNSSGITPDGNLLGATWNDRMPSTPWISGGGDFTTLLSSASDDPSNNDGNTGAGSRNLTFATSTAFVAAAQSALDGSTPLSVLLKLNDTSEGQNLRRAFFYDSDNTVDGSPVLPFFAITYDIPEPSVTFLAASGAALVLLRRRRSR